VRVYTQRFTPEVPPVNIRVHPSGQCVIYYYSEYSEIRQFCPFALWVRGALDWYANCYYESLPESWGWKERGECSTG
jgi:hypothetical protein